MIFEKTSVRGAYVLRPERIEDERGFFARAWCRREFAEQGLETHLEQFNISYNKRRGTLRGMHYQCPPHEEVKLVRCTRGAIHDVIIDIDPSSPSYLRHAAVRLSADERNLLYIPKRCAHGFLTLDDDTEVFYQMSARYAPDCGRGVRYDDPAFGIEWPEEVKVINERDRTYPDYCP